MTWQSDLVNMFTDVWGLKKEDADKAIGEIENLNEVADGPVEEILVGVGVPASAAEIAAPAIVAGVEAA